jgi:hypothetical protein
VINPGVLCLAPKQLVNGQCLDPCPPGQFRQKNGSCKPLVINPGVLCLAPKQLVNGQCLDPCPPGQFRQKNGSCKPLVINPGVLCLAPKQLVNGQCLDPCPPGQFRQKNGSCKLLNIIVPPKNKLPNGKFPLQNLQAECQSPKEMVNGQCVNPCPAGEVRRKNGSCGPVQLNPVIKLNPNIMLQMQNPN